MHGHFMHQPPGNYALLSSNAQCSLSIHLGNSSARKFGHKSSSVFLLIISLRQQILPSRPTALHCSNSLLSLRLRGGGPVDKEPAKKAVAAALERAHEQAQSFVSKIKEPTREGATAAFDKAGGQAQSYLSKLSEPTQEAATNALDKAQAYLSKIKEPTREAAVSAIDKTGERAQSLLSKIRTGVAGAPKSPVALTVAVGLVVTCVIGAHRPLSPPARAGWPAPIPLFSPLCAPHSSSLRTAAAFSIPLLYSPAPIPIWFKSS